MAEHLVQLLDLDLAWAAAELLSRFRLYVSHRLEADYSTPEADQASHLPESYRMPGLC